MVDLAEILKQKESELEKLRAEIEILREASRICSVAATQDLAPPKFPPASETSATPAFELQAGIRRFV